MYTKRSYRNLFENELTMFNVCIGQTDLMIGCDADFNKEAQGIVRKVRSILTAHISRHPAFETSLVPMKENPEYPRVINRMLSAGIITGTGPMAAVAGAVAQYVGEKLLKFSKQVFVENGGDIFFASEKDRIIGIYAGKSPLTNRLAIKIKQDRFPLGICTSSGTVGHSYSMGKADAVTILAKNTALADAAATAVANRIIDTDDIEPALEFALGIKGVSGVLAVIGDKLGAAGDIELAPLGKQI